MDPNVLRCLRVNAGMVQGELSEKVNRYWEENPPEGWRRCNQNRISMLELGLDVACYDETIEAIRAVLKPVCEDELSAILEAHKERL